MQTVQLPQNSYIRLIAIRMTDISDSGLLKQIPVATFGVYRKRQERNGSSVSIHDDKMFDIGVPVAVTALFQPTHAELIDFAKTAAKELAKNLDGLSRSLKDHIDSWSDSADANS